MLIKLSKTATIYQTIYRTGQLTTISYSTTRQMAGPDSSSVSTETCNLEVPGSNPGRDGYCHRGCAYTMLKLFKVHGVLLMLP